MKLKFLLSNLFALVLTFNVDAAVKSIVCNGCTTADMSSAAKYTQRMVGSSYIAVFDFDDYTAKKFQTTLSFTAQGEPSRSVYEVAFTPDEQFDVDLILAFRADFVDMLENKHLDVFVDSFYTGENVGVASLTISSTYLRAGELKVKGSPYDFLVTSALRNNAFDYYMKGNNAKFTELVDSSLNAVSIPSGQDMELYIDVNFTSDGTSIDNGTIKVSFDFFNAVFVVMSAKDGDNNSIPLDLDDVSGVYTFVSPNGETTFLNYINIMFSSSTVGDCTVTNRNTSGNVHSFAFSC